MSVAESSDPATDTVTGSVTLDGQNPYVVKYVPELDRIVSASVGSFFAEDGGLETVNPNDDTAEGFILLNSTLGVVATTDFDFVTPTQLFGLTTTSTFGTAVYRLSLTGDPIIATLASSESFDFFDINYRNIALYVLPLRQLFRRYPQEIGHRTV